jgi:hypothetical protein
MKCLSLFFLIAVASGIAFAASDCEHSCCYKFNGYWDEDFDDCKSADAGYDTCVSDCESAIWDNLPQPDTSGGTHYECKVGFVLLAVLGCAVFIQQCHRRSG